MTDSTFDTTSFVANSEETTGNITSQEEIHYNDGDEIQVTWHVGFFFLAYFTAFIGSYSAIRILEHGLWRSEKEKSNATRKFKFTIPR